VSLKVRGSPFEPNTAAVCSSTGEDWQLSKGKGHYSDWRDGGSESRSWQVTFHTEAQLIHNQTTQIHAGSVWRS